MKDYSNLVIYMAYYTPQQHALLLKLADDRNKLNDTWKELFEGFIKAKEQLPGDCEIEDFYVDVEKMDAHFRKNNMLNIGANRAKYVTEQGMLAHNKRRKF